LQKPQGWATRLQRRKFKGVTAKAQLKGATSKTKRTAAPLKRALNQEFLAPAVATLLQEEANRVYNASNSSQVPG
jgi:hypothetical protein